MSQGKYSPSLTREMISSWDEYTFQFAAGGKTPEPYVVGNTIYNEEIHYADYDKDGFDRYGYSAYLEDGTFVGIGQGIDRWGYTEDEYMSMSSEEFCSIDGPK